MFKAKINSLEKIENESGVPSLTSFEAVFSDGDVSITKVFNYNEYPFSNKDGLANILQEECNRLDSTHGTIQTIEDCIGVEDVVAVIKS